MLQAGMLPAKRVVVPRITHIRPPHNTCKHRSQQARLLSVPPSRTVCAEQGDIREHQDEREGKCRDKACDCQGKEAMLFLTTASTKAPHPIAAEKAKNNDVVEKLGCAVSVFFLG